MTQISVYLKAILAFLTSVITSVTMLICPTPASTPEATLTSERCYSLDGAYVTGQGLDCEDGYYYTSGALSAFSIGGLAKIDMATGEIVAQNLLALPQEFRNKDYDHIGDIAVQDGIIYAPVEDKAEEYPLILLYDAETLEYTGTYYEMDATYLTDGIPWCAVDENYLYASPINYPAQIAVFNLADMSFSHTIPLTQPIHRVQAGDCEGGTLYLNCDPKEGNKTVYAVDLTTGETTLLFDRNTTGYDTEAEGICVTTDEDGTLTFHIADYNKLLSTFIRTYQLTA